jgi:hypothetical protein
VRKGAGALVGPLLLVALTSVTGFWALQSTRSSSLEVASAAVRPTPDVPTIPVSHPRASARDFQAGVSVVIYGNDPYFDHKAKVLLNRLASLGANSVSLVIPIFQQGWAASEVYTDPIKTPTDAAVSAFATQARRRGFTVMLRPLVDIVVPQDSTHWRGSIQPQDPARWKQTYGALLIKYAGLAQANEIAVLDIGSELDSMERDNGFWLGLIGSVRANFHGQVTYSSNWAKSFPAFGHSLDFVSIDAYYPLKAPVAASTSDLANAWQPWIARLNRIRQMFGKPLLLTELGTTSLLGSFQMPWIWDNGQPVDLTAQQRYYQAACQAVVPRFSGVYWWMYTLDPPSKPALDRGYMIAGKPAEADLAHCFGGTGLH